MRWVQLCGCLSILWHCPSLRLEWKLTFSSPVATAEFSKFAGILNALWPYLQPPCCDPEKVSSVQSLSRVRLSTPGPPVRHQTPGVHPNPCPLCRWWHPTISSSVVLFSCPQSFPASGAFQMSQLSESGGRSIGVSASTSVPPMNTQDWSPLGWTGWISLQSKGLSRVFSNNTVQKHQLFGAQLSL